MLLSDGRFLLLRTTPLPGDYAILEIRDLATGFRDSEPHTHSVLRRAHPDGLHRSTRSRGLCGLSAQLELAVLAVTPIRAPCRDGRDRADGRCDGSMQRALRHPCAVVDRHAQRNGLTVDGSRRWCSVNQAPVESITGPARAAGRRCSQRCVERRLCINAERLAGLRGAWRFASELSLDGSSCAMHRLIIRAHASSDTDRRAPPILPHREHHTQPSTPLSSREHID